MPEGKTEEYRRMIRAGTPAAGAAVESPDAAVQKAMQEWAKKQNPFLAATMASRQFILDRLPQEMKTGWLREAPTGTMEALADQQRAASAVGGAFFPVAAGLAVPGTIVAQGLTAGGLELAKKVSGKDVGVREVGTEAGLASLAQGGGNLATRVMSGISRATAAYRGSRVLPTTSQPLRIVGETGLGRGTIEDLNQKVLTQKLGRVFGIDEMAELNGTNLKIAESNIAKAYDEALEISSPVDTVAAWDILDDIPNEMLPGKKKLLTAIQGVNDSQSLRGVHRALRDKIAQSRRDPSKAGWVDEMQEALEALNNAATESGADLARLGEANQRWKVLRTVDEVPEAWQRGQIEPKTFANRFGRENFKGFGRSIKRGESNLQPDVQSFVDDVLTLAADPRAVGRTGTAESLLVGGGAVGGGTALQMGVDPAAIGTGLLAYGTVPPIAALGSVGDPLPLVGKIAAGGRSLRPDDEQ